MLKSSRIPTLSTLVTNHTPTQIPGNPHLFPAWSLPFARQKTQPT